MQSFQADLRLVYHRKRMHLARAAHPCILSYLLATEAVILCSCQYALMVWKYSELPRTDLQKQHSDPLIVVVDDDAAVVGDRSTTT